MCSLGNLRPIGDYLAVILPDVSVSLREQHKLRRQNDGRTTENHGWIILPMNWTTACGKSAVSARIAARRVPEEFRVMGFSIHAAVNPDSSGQSRRSVRVGGSRVSAVAPASS